MPTHKISSAEREDIIATVNSKFDALILAQGFLKRRGYYFFECENTKRFIAFKRHSSFQWCPTFELKLGLSFELPKSLKNELSFKYSEKSPWLMVDSRRASERKLLSVGSDNFSSERKKLKGRYLANNPGIWEFRNENEIDKKIKGIEKFLIELGFPYFDILSSHKHTNGLPNQISVESKPVYRVYQLYVAWDSNDRARYVEILNSFSHSIPSLVVVDKQLFNLYKKH